MKKKKYKSFPIDKLSDALLALGSIIAPSIMNLDKYHKYTKQAEDVFSKCQERGEKCIPGDLYEEIKDKALFRQRELLALMADEANDVFSYKNLRRKLKTKGYITRDIEKEVSEILNELLAVRNGTFHNVQSRLVAQLETIKKTFPVMLDENGKVIPQLGIIIDNRISSCTIEMLASLIHHNYLRGAQFEIVLNSMKQDYQDMYDKLSVRGVVMTPGLEPLVENCHSITPVRVMVHELVYGAQGDEAYVPNISMAIQKGKYDGTTEAFDKYTKGKREDGARKSETAEKQDAESAD